MSGLQGPALRKQMQEKAKFVAEYEREQRRPIDQMAQSNARLTAEIAERENAIKRSTMYTIIDPELAARLPKYETLSLTTEQANAAVLKAYTRWATWLTEQQGVTVKPAGRELLRRLAFLYCTVSADTTQPDTFNQLWQYAESVGAVTDEHCTKPEPQPVTQHEPESLPDLETLDVSTRDGRREAERLLTESLVDEAAVLYREFRQYLLDKWDYTIDQETGDRCVNFIRRSNLNLCDKRSWDAARRQVLKLQLKDEALASTIESSPEFVGSYAAKQEIRRRQQESLNS
jgi:hypothetical protein